MEDPSQQPPLFEGHADVRRLILPGNSFHLKSPSPEKRCGICVAFPRLASAAHQLGMAAENRGGVGVEFAGPSLNSELFHWPRLFE